MDDMNLDQLLQLYVQIPPRPLTLRRRPQQTAWWLDSPEPEAADGVAG